ncbi:MAG: histidine kinase [Gemmatimonadales bacterium]|nr:histidine kinase [Gemmatimonadales bacterium]
MIDAIGALLGWLVAAPLLVSTTRRWRPARVGWPLATILLSISVSIGVLVASAVRHGAARLAGTASELGFLPSLAINLDRHILFAIAIMATTLAFDERLLLRRRALRLAELEADAAVARLRVLEAQLHPHFLFNTLHAIAALIQQRGADATRMIERLRQLLALTLEPRERPDVPLEEELRLVEAYVAIQRVRFGDALAVTIDVEPALLKEAVPRLILQPLVENAILHGLAGAPGTGRIAIRGNRVGREIVLRVSDNGRGPEAVDAPHSFGREGGLGLENTRRRLTNRYGNGASLALGAEPGGGCAVTLRFPADPAPFTADGASHHDPRVPLRRFVRNASIGFAAGTVAWVALTTLYRRLGATDLSPDRLVVMALVQNAIFALVLGAAAWLFSRMPIDGPDRRRNGLLHMAIPVGTFGIHLLLDGLVRRLVDLPALHALPLLFFHVGACLAVAALVQGAYFARRSHAADSAAAAREREAAEAAFALQRLRLRPDAVDRWLARVGELAGPAPARGIELVVAIGDYLRLVARAGTRPAPAPADLDAMAVAAARVEELVPERSGGG